MNKIKNFLIQHIEIDTYTVAVMAVVGFGVIMFELGRLDEGMN